MKFRTATLADIARMQYVRHSVKENTLSDPALVPDKDVAFYITEKGKGWVCEVDDELVGFSIVDLMDKSVWALFVHPDHEGKGIGKALHHMMLDWYFDQEQEWVCLGTSPNTRAADFYRLQGWTTAGTYSNGEIKFHLSAEDWKNRK